MLKIHYQFNESANQHFTSEYELLNASDILKDDTYEFLDISIQNSDEEYVNSELAEICYICGFKSYNSIIHKHHIVPRSQGGKNTKDNLIPVCPNCHSLIHVGKYDKEFLYEIKHYKTQFSKQVIPADKVIAQE